MTVDFRHGRWLNPPQSYETTPDAVTIRTDPHTDFWQRSYYGFRNNNAPALLLPQADNFTFSARVDFDYVNQFDQCGLLVWLDAENWCKVSIEYENPAYSRLGSVVTNHGYSDWATTDLITPNRYFYRISRRGPDFLLEASPTRDDFRQMRVLHLHQLGETTLEMGRTPQLSPPAQPVQVGVYACSPLASRFTAVFSHFQIGPVTWKMHPTGD